LKQKCFTFFEVKATTTSQAFFEGITTTTGLLFLK